MLSTIRKSKVYGTILVVFFAAAALVAVGCEQQVQEPATVPATVDVTEPEPVVPTTPVPTPEPAPVEVPPAVPPIPPAKYPQLSFHHPLHPRKYLIPNRYQWSHNLNLYRLLKSQNQNLYRLGILRHL